jgi:leucyl/phenylalanyl-tRNA--protein transferase
MAIYEVLSPDLLLSAYCQGVFPMAHPNGDIYWYDPDPRAILPLDERFHVSRTLARTVQQGKFEIRIDSDFTAVMQACAELKADREETWINEELIAAYTRLHKMGFAHSVEAWRNGRLVGGLYGVAIRGFFAGESMFSHERDSSKVALVHLVERLRQRRYQLLDTQFMTNHLRTFGALEVPAANYKLRLAYALTIETRFGD